MSSTCPPTMPPPPVEPLITSAKARHKIGRSRFPPPSSEYLIASSRRGGASDASNSSREVRSDSTRVFCSARNFAWKASAEPIESPLLGLGRDQLLDARNQRRQLDGLGKVVGGSCFDPALHV